MVRVGKRAREKRMKKRMNASRIYVNIINPDSVSCWEGVIITHSPSIWISLTTIKIITRTSITMKHAWLNSKDRETSSYTIHNTQWNLVTRVLIVNKALSVFKHGCTTSTSPFIFYYFVPKYSKQSNPRDLVIKWFHCVLYMIINNTKSRALRFIQNRK